jgi:hypothetical protein
MDIRGINWQRLDAPQNYAAEGGMRRHPDAQSGEGVKGSAILWSYAILFRCTLSATLKQHVSKQNITDKRIPAVRLIVPRICTYIDTVVAGNLHGWREMWGSSFITKYFPLFKCLSVYSAYSGVCVFRKMVCENAVLYRLHL